MRATSVFVSLAIAAAGALAQGYPQKPIQLVVPFPPGGATDTVGRLVAQKLATRLGQPVTVDNRAGAGTVIGAGFVAKAPPDGYTLLISSGSTFTINPAINPRLPYDPVRSFDPLALVARVPLLIVAGPQAPFKNVGQLISAAKAEPGKYSYASFGTGTTSHFAGEQFLRATGVKIVHVPYKGSAPAITDLIGGQIPVAVDTVTATLPHIRSGRLKPLAMTGARRSTLLPDVPTVAESGYPGFDADSWLAIVGPRGIPAAVKQRLEQAIVAAMSDPEVRAHLLSQGLEPAHAGSAAVAALIDSELPRMRAIATRAGITSD